MSSLARQIKRKKEKDELKEIHTMYHKKAKNVCPKCHKKSLFMTNEKGETYCMRCDKLITIKEK